MRWWTQWLLMLATVLIPADGRVSSDTICSVYADGCTTYGLYASYLALFKLPCDRHDICYTCGAAYNISRVECDEAFSLDMQAACVFGVGADHTLALAHSLQPGPTGHSTLHVCVETSHNFYLAVRGLGWLYFVQAETTPRFCFQPWVAACLPDLQK